jgi:foldase protein PrsA
MYLVVKSQSATSPTAPVIVPNDPPGFKNCIAEAKAAYATLRKESDAAVRKTCDSDFTSLSGDVINFFIQGYWYQAYAHKLGIHVTSAQVAKQLATEKKAQGIKTNAQWHKFLSQYGYTQGDINWQVLSTLVQKKLIARYDTKVTKADIAAYYNSHKSTFGTAETRSMRIVLAKNDSTAKRALAALKSGQSWKTVAKKYSTDPTTKNDGGLLLNVSKGQQDAALTNAAFAAPVNKLIGPIKGSFGYYVVEVTKITPATQESLAKATPQIKTTLTTSKQTQAGSALGKKVKSLYGARTLCAKYYVVADCHGYKKPKATSSATPTTPETSSSTTTSSSSK